MHVYVQRTGHLYHNGTLLWTGYSGGNKGTNPEGVNNPEMENVHCVGPLPRGLYTIEAPRNDAKLGPYVLDLTPDPSNEMFGRSEFRIHGDNSTANHSASEGCIIKSPKANRQKVWDSGDHQLTVVAEEDDRVNVPTV